MPRNSGRDDGVDGDVRPARKAGTGGDRGWYKGDPVALSAELDDFLARVPDTVDGSSLPVPGARIIIAPHAGYAYSGPNAAWAYRCLDLSQAKRIFILGPSHHSAFHGVRLSQFRQWATPLGPLTVDQDALQALRDGAGLSDMPRGDDADEHSLELHAPYVYKRCEETFGSGSPDRFPKIAPLIVGRTSARAEKDLGQVLLPYLKDAENAFVISSDFCHWGSWFSYLPYSADRDVTKLRHLSEYDATPAGIPVHECIEAIDEHAMNAVESGSHDAFTGSIRLTGNTVCGRHPIGIALAALELYSDEVKQSRFKVVKYDRSEKVVRPNQTSVSYVSAYAVL